MAIFGSASAPVESMMKSLSGLSYKLPIAALVAVSVSVAMIGRAFTLFSCLGRTWGAPLALKRTDCDGLALELGF